MKTAFSRPPSGYIGPFPNFHTGDRAAATDADWWDTVDAETLRCTVRRQRAGQIQKVDDFLIPTMAQYGFTKDNAQVLSVGCGMGFDVLRLKEHGYSAVGTDFGGRTKQWTEIGLTGDDLFLCDVEQLPLARDAGFNVIFMWHVIEHFGTSDGNQTVRAEKRKIRRRIVAKCWEILPPGGIAILGTPNRLFPLDQYHGAHLYLYPDLRAFALAKGIGLHMPWSRKNFLLSKWEIRQAFEDFREIKWLPVGNGMALSKGEFLSSSKLARLSGFIETYVRFLDRFRLHSSPISPVLHAVAIK